MHHRCTPSRQENIDRSAAGVRAAAARGADYMDGPVPEDILAGIAANNAAADARAPAADDWNTDWLVMPESDKKGGA